MGDKRRSTRQATRKPTRKPTRASYHHGDLAEALVRVASERIARDGVDNFRLREATRSLGVDIAAVYRHYKNRDELLGAVADAAVARFASELDVARLSQTSGDRQLEALGASYVRFAMDNPHLFRLIFSSVGIGSVTDPKDIGTLPRPGQVFLQVIEECHRSGITDLSFLEGGILTWTGIHGLACLVVDGVLPRDMVNQHVADITAGLLRSLRAR